MSAAIFRCLESLELEVDMGLVTYRTGITAFREVILGIRALADHGGFSLELKLNFLLRIAPPRQSWFKDNFVFLTPDALASLTLLLLRSSPKIKHPQPDFPNSIDLLENSN
ncbi:hypothetical protein ACOSP7_024007 [Xanthoceras sorbifolium]